ncbi:Protein cramped-like protein [Dirofilaria immitis]|nr:Protein cramped-like protein [Dirofilaria immitis]
MSTQPGSKADEEARSELGSSTSTAAIPKRRIIYRPFSLNSQTVTTTVTATIRDTLIAVRDAVAASITTTASSTLSKASTNTSNTVAEATTINNDSSSISNASQQHTVCSNNPEVNAVTPAIGVINKVPCRWEQWNSSEINAFFEGIKLYGKDFEQMAKLMARRKLNKDKDQVRNYYFNSLKLLRSSTRIDETLMAGIPRDVKELFILINGFEWKRRVCGKFDQAKFQQLVMEGLAYLIFDFQISNQHMKKEKEKAASTSAYASCSSSPLPSHIFICLTPKTEADRYFVEQRGQNPLIRIRVAIGDQLSRIFSFLKIKWNLRMQKLLGVISKEEEQVKVVLYPDKTTRVGKIIVNLYEATPTIFSINRQDLLNSLIRELQRTGSIEQNSESSKRRNANAGEETSEDVEMLSPTEDDDDGPFTINGSKLCSGLTERNVQKATVTELYYLCGKESEIKLVYSTGLKRMGDPEPWRIFLHLLDRGYGDSLCKCLADPQKIAESDESIEQKWQERIRKRCKLANNCTEQSSNDLTSSAEITETTEAAAHEMVEAENSALCNNLKNSGIKQTVALNPPSLHQPIATTTRSSAVADKTRPRDSTNRIWSDAGISSGFKSDNSDGIRTENGYFVQKTNASSHPTQIQHVTEAGYQLVNPVFVTHKIATSTSAVQFISSSDNNAGGIGHSINNFMRDTDVPMCPAQEITAVRYQMAGPIFMPENAQSTSGQFVIPVSSRDSSNNEHFMQRDDVVQKILTPTESSGEPNGSCDANDRVSLPSSPAKENSLLRELHSAPSMDKSIEVMLQENSTECYRFVEQFASTMNSRSNVVSNVINAENEITRIAQQLAQSADDALRSVDGSSVKMRSDDDNDSVVSIDDATMIKSVKPDTVAVRCNDDKKKRQDFDAFLCFCFPIFVCLG